MVKIVLIGLAVIDVCVEGWFDLSGGEDGLQMTVFVGVVRHCLWWLGWFGCGCSSGDGRRVNIGSVSFDRCCEDCGGGCGHGTVCCGYDCSSGG